MFVSSCIQKLLPCALKTKHFTLHHEQLLLKSTDFREVLPIIFFKHCPNPPPPHLRFFGDGNLFFLLCFELSKHDTFEIGYRSFLMSFRISLKVKLAEKNNNHVYINWFWGNLLLKKCPKQFGKGGIDSIAVSMIADVLVELQCLW